jgi:hypothetical protein
MDDDVFINVSNSDLKVGQIVLCVKKAISNRNIKNKIGSVIYKGTGIITVQFFDMVEGHDGLHYDAYGNSIGKDGYCWNFSTQGEDFKLFKLIGSLNETIE